MRMIHDLPAAGVLLRWGGFLAVVIAIIGGILSIHIVASGSMTATQMSTESAAASSHVNLDGDNFADTAVAHSALHSPTAVRAALNCPATEHTANMSIHSDCTPAIGSASVSVPLPGTLTHLGPGAAFLHAPIHEAADRPLDPPSLKQLSISRT